MKGPFGEIETTAAVSDGVLPTCPYILSNKTAKSLSDFGKELAMNPVLVVTRSMTRDNTSAVPEPENPPVLAEVESEPVVAEPSLVSPASVNFEELSKVDTLTLISEQAADDSLEECRKRISMPSKKVSFFLNNGVLYRSYTAKGGREYDQLVVPAKYRAQLLELAHAKGWSCHLGIKKTKARLLAEYYWPGCFKEAEQFVRSCDVCQRTGRPNEKVKAPLTCVPIITEPFKRQVIDVVGPLPVTKSGYRYLLTFLCPASKFPEAVPLREHDFYESRGCVTHCFLEGWFSQ